MHFCIKNVSIELPAAAMLFFSLLVYAEKGSVAEALIVAVSVHELSHIAALKHYGAKIRKIQFGTGGMNIAYSGSVSERGELVSALAGPVGGLLLSVLCESAGKSGVVSETAEISLLLSLFNLLPAYSLDGGRALTILLHRCLPSDACRRLTLSVGQTVSTLLLCLGVCLLRSGVGLLPLLAGLRMVCTDSEHL